MFGTAQTRQTHIVSAILAAMQTIIRLTLLCSLSLGLVWAQFAHAGDTVSPPPKHDAASAHEHAMAAEPSHEEGSFNLNKDLAPPKASDGVDVRTYLRENDKAQITEYSSHGRVFRIKVQPSGGLPAYYLEDDNGDGTFNKRIAGGYKRINPPMWIIKRF